MKSDQLLLYKWQRGVFLNKQVFNYNIYLYDLRDSNFGFNYTTLLFCYKRLELNKSLIFNRGISLNSFRQFEKVAINVLLSKMYSVYGSCNLLNLFMVVKFYLINSYKGRCHMLGKPSNGQRTWSNAWNAFKVNLVTRKFVNKYLSNKNTKNTKKSNKISLFNPIKKKKIHWF